MKKKILSIILVSVMLVGSLSVQPAWAEEGNAVENSANIESAAEDNSAENVEKSKTDAVYEESDTEEGAGEVTENIDEEEDDASGEVAACATDTMNVLEVNKTYYIKDLKMNDIYSGQQYYNIKVNCPGNGRVRVFLEDCMTDTIDYWSGQWEALGTDTLRTYWCTVKEQEKTFDIKGKYKKTINQEATVTIQYQSIDEYNGEIEDNNSFDTATPIELNTEYEGDYGDGGKDYFKFSFEQSGLVEIDLGKVAFNLYKEDANGNVSVILANSNTARVRLGEGNYFVLVMPYFENGQQEYALKVNATYEDPDSYEQESNNVKSQANEKELNHWYIGNIQTSNDVDCYKFEVTEDSLLSLEFRVPRQMSLDTYRASICDQNLKVLQTVSNTSNPYLQTEAMRYPAGTYYVRVTRGEWLSTRDYSFNLNQEPFIEVSNIKIPSTKTIYVGKTYAFKPTIAPKNATEPSLEWSSSNESVATVDENGVVHATYSNYCTGTTTITASATDGSGVYATCKVKVTPVKVSKITLSSTSRQERPSNRFQLSASVRPGNAYNKAIKWSTTNSKVASVDSTGMVTIWKPGYAEIKATAKDGSNVSATCKIKAGYILAYQLNGGKNNSANPNFFTGKKIVLRNPSRKGYVFKGWYENRWYNKRMKEIPSNLCNHLCLEAKWEKVKVGTTAITSLTNKSGKKLWVKCRAVSPASGYKVMYSTDKNFQKDCSSVLITTNGVTLTNLTKQKNYYVKVCAYRRDSSGKNVYGKYSEVKKVKITK